MRNSNDDELGDEVAVDKMYREVKASGFISEAALSKKYSVEKIKSLDDIRIPGFENINPYKIEAINYLLLRLRNHGYDFGYNEWLKEYGIDAVKKRINATNTKGVEVKIVSLMYLLSCLLDELGEEMQSAKVEPVYWKNVIARRETSIPSTRIRRDITDEELEAETIGKQIVSGIMGVIITLVSVFVFGLFWKGPIRVFEVFSNAVGFFISPITGFFSNNTSFVPMLSIIPLLVAAAVMITFLTYLLNYSSRR